MRPENRIYHFISLLLLAVVVRVGAFWSIHVIWLLLLPVAAVVHGRLRKARGKSGLSPIAIPYAVAIVWIRVFVQYRLGFKRRRHKDASQPRGFCPSCGYPMNPGRCPECGADVSAISLHRRKVTKFRHHRRKLVALAVIVIVGFGGPVAYFHVDWASRLSSESLLRLQTWRIRPVEMELLRRYSNGALDKPTKEKFFDQAMESRYEALPVYPSGIAFYGHVHMDCQIPRLLKTDQFYLREHHVLVDGVEIHEHSAIMDAKSKDRYRGHWVIGGPVLEPGEHEVTIAGVVTISAADQLDLVDTLAIHTTKFSVSTKVRVENRPASDFVEAVKNPEVVESIQKLIRAGGRIPITDFSRGYFDPEIHAWMYKRSIRIDYLGSNPVQIIGQLHIRPAGEGEFERLGWIHLKSGSQRYWALPETKAFEAADRVDFRIVPDATVAVQQVDRMNTQYYGGDIKFDGVKVPRLPSGRSFLP